MLFCARVEQRKHRRARLETAADSPSPARPAGRQAIELIFAGHAVAHAGEEYVRPTWDCWTFEYIVAGRGVFEIERHSHELEAGDLYVLPKGLAHRYQADRDDPWHKLYFVVDGPVVSALWQVYGIGASYSAPDWASAELFERMIHLWETRPNDLRDRAALVLHEVLASLARRFDDQGPRFSPAVARAVEWIDGHLERAVDVDEIAAAASLSRSHLSRVFKKEVGLSPYEYLIQQRIALAREWLQHTPLSVTEIAERLCYADAYYFSNAFKQHVGVAPTRFRDAERRGESESGD